MENKALISVMSKQNGDDDNSIEVVTPGIFYKERDCYFAVYDETEISGMEGTKTTLKIAPDKFSLMRIGTTTTNMDFEKDNKYLTLYNTPYGALELEIQTKILNISMNDRGGDVYINYNMCITGQPPQETSLKINIKVH